MAEQGQRRTITAMPSAPFAAPYCTKQHAAPRIANRLCSACRRELEGTQRLHAWLDDALLVWTHVNGNYRTADPGGDHSVDPGRPLSQASENELVLPGGGTTIGTNGPYSTGDLTIERITTSDLQALGIDPDAFLADLTDAAGVPRILVNGHVARQIRDIVTLETQTPGSLHAALETVRSQRIAPSAGEGARTRLITALMDPDTRERLTRHRPTIEKNPAWTLGSFYTQWPGQGLGDDRRLLDSEITWLTLAGMNQPAPSAISEDHFNLRDLIVSSTIDGDTLIATWEHLTLTEQETALKLARGWEGTLDQLIEAAKRV